MGWRLSKGALSVRLCYGYCATSQGSLDSFEVQGGEDTSDALNYKSFSTKEPLIIRLFCGKWAAHSEWAFWWASFDALMRHLNQFQTQTPLLWVLCHFTGFARLVRITKMERYTECLQSQVIFRHRATNYKTLLRKTTFKDKTSYGSSPPCRPQCSPSTRIHGDLCVVYS